MRILGLTEITHFGVNGEVTKLKYFSYINARMTPSILCNFEFFERHIEASYVLHSSYYVLHSTYYVLRITSRGEPLLAKCGDKFFI